ncbi:MAG: 23S rRNA (uracil(1939)-C(5))-methyltransferase RlmD, partial [Gammaproteobacteria bacterium]|nr:23S rRNA (uracil(1939)-C(5))-methyltransferase RlmD [Gammaproteobacteria bacterium]
MSRRTRKLPTEPVTATIESMTHEGKGVTHIDGKAVFVHGTLPDEEVRFQYTRKSRRYDEAKVVEVLKPSPLRVEPKCKHFGLCGGCSLQHLDSSEQIKNKQQILLDNLQRIGKVEAKEILAPMTASAWGYRRKARLGVKHVRKKEKVLVGFREKGSGLLAELEQCEVLHESVGKRLLELAELVRSLSCYEKIPQIEVAVSDDHTALVFRHLEVLTKDDMTKLTDFAKSNDLYIYLQSAGPDSITPLWPENPELSYRLDDFDVEVFFEPSDFVQVNTEINRKMIPQAIELLDVQSNDRVLELFCGVGNFSFALARKAEHVTAVEGEKVLVDRARENAKRNKIENVEFHVADLFAVDPQTPWLKQDYTKILLDPARTGADAILPTLAKMKVSRIVYVSCNPATLARDAGILCNEY